MPKEETPAAPGEQPGATETSTEFDAAFSEFAAQDDTLTQEEPAAEPAGTPAAEAAEEAPEVTEEPAEEPATEETPAADPAASAEEGADPAPAEDIWANATPEQRAAYDAAQHEIKSNRGRIRALQQKSRPRPAKRTPESGSEAPNPADSDAWKSFASDYPEVAGPVQAMLDAQSETINELRGRLDERDATDTAQALDAQEEILIERHPEYVKLTSTDEFVAWLDSQPQFVMDGFQRNAESIVDGEEAAKLLDLYVQETQKPEPDPEPDPAPAGAGADEGGTGNNPRRQRRLESAVTSEDKGPGPSTGPVDDFDAAFDHYASA